MQAISSFHDIEFFHPQKGLTVKIQADDPGHQAADALKANIPEGRVVVVEHRGDGGAVSADDDPLSLLFVQHPGEACDVAGLHLP